MTKQEQQLKLETEAYNNSYKRYLDDLTRQIQSGDAHELPESKVLMKLAVEKVAVKLDEYFETRQQREANEVQIALLDYIDNTKELAYLAIRTVMSTLSAGAVATPASLAIQINRIIARDYVLKQADKEQPKLMAYIERRNKKLGKRKVLQKKEFYAKSIKKHKHGLGESMLNAKRMKIGAVILDCIGDKAGLSLIQLTLVKHRQNTRFEYRFTDEAFQLMLSIRETTNMMFQIYPIFVVPPLSWRGLDGSGGYYSNKLYKDKLIKLGWGHKGVVSKVTQFMEIRPITRYIHQVNRIQATKWQVNKRVYNIMETVMKGNLIDYDTPRVNPRLVGGLPFNEKQDPLDYLEDLQYPDTEEGNNKKKVDRDTAEVRINTTLSKAMAMNRVMMEAKKYLHEEAIYFSYQADRRGRIYPMQQNLQPQASGGVKALLQFGNGAKITTAEQLRWFKIYGANCYGDDKSLYTDRVKTAERLENEIRLIASDPLCYNHLWKDADEPYLYLAWCFEYADYMADPEGFVSHIPIALDATCSGIQIYSGLLLDKEGAEAVNVIGKTRNDIYQQVADVANNYLNKGDYDRQYEQKHSDGEIKTFDVTATANSVKGKINRKLTKTNTMTVPYSVTSFGMSEQIKEVMETLKEEGKQFWVGEDFIARTLIRNMNQRAIYEVVKGAKIGQEFLKKVNREVGKKGDMLFFTSPIFDFPVYLDVYKQDTEEVDTQVGKLSINTWTDKKNVAKMGSGVAPNFIHCLDSTLMMLTLEKMKDCESFHMIHDSYGFPIDQVEDFNTQVREAFIEIFEARPLERFTRQVCPEMEEEARAVMVDTLDINEVRGSEYIFS